MKLFKKIIIFTAMCYLPFTSSAWGIIGHRVVGEIADSYLTKKTKKAIAAILGNESVAMASNWPDFIKSDPNYRYLNNWHYVNLKSDLTFDEVNNFLTADTATDAYTKINFLVNEMKTNTLLPNETKVMYIRLLIHIIGDIHQPMHLGKPDDRGGNAVKLKWFDEPTNLHAVWDEKLVEFQELSYTEYAKAINFTTKEQRNSWKQQSLVQWIYDTYTLTGKVYAESMPDSRLDYLYNFKFLAPMNDQLLKGGFHLATVLNDIFK